MLKHLTILCSFIALALQSNAQVNLVPNGSFEVLDSCPKQGSQLHYANGWFAPSLGTPDLFNDCDTLYSPVDVPTNFAGDQYAKDGQSYAGIVTVMALGLPPETYREYIAIKLDTSLEKNKYYCFTMYCSRGDEAYYSYLQNGYTVYVSPAIGIYFSEDSTYQNTAGNLSFVPQIQNPITNPIDCLTAWTKVEGVFKSVTGNEQYIYIGNFYNDADTPYSILYPGNSPHWPNVYLYIDDISLVECEGVGLQENQSSLISIYPNPAAENVTIPLPPNTNKAELLVYTIQGQLLSQTQLTGTQTINTSNLANGVYLFVIQSNGSIVGREKVVIAH